MKIFNPSINIKILDFASKSNISKWMNIFDENKSWSAQDIKIYQEKKLRNLLNHAYQNCSYYQEYDIDLREIESIDDLKELPVIRRKDISDNLNRIKALNISDFSPISRSTGGTTGRPLKYFSNNDSWSLGWALKYRDWSYGGYEVGDKIALLGGASLIPDEKPTIKRKVWNRINGFYPLSTTHYNQNILNSYYNVIKNNKIRFLRGYPTSILSFAEHIKNNKQHLNIKAIYTTAEVLQESHRTYIEEIFKCKIYDQYGAADANAHASQCEEVEGYHISFEPSICEVINIEENYDGKKIGELVFTSLTNYAMPTIRYAPGDYAEISDNNECECGRKTIKIKKIVGRTTERIKFSNGNVLAGPAFTLIFRKFNLHNYQLVQNFHNKLDINLIKNEDYTIKEEKEILKIMKYHCGAGIEIAINYVDEIKLPMSGKHNFIVSNVKANDSN